MLSIVPIISEIREQVPKEVVVTGDNSWIEDGDAFVSLCIQYKPMVDEVVRLFEPWQFSKSARNS